MSSGVLSRYLAESVEESTISVIDPFSVGSDFVGTIEAGVFVCSGKSSSGSDFKDDEDEDEDIEVECWTDPLTQLTNVDFNLDIVDMPFVSDLVSLLLSS